MKPLAFVVVSLVLVAGTALAAPPPRTTPPRPPSPPAPPTMSPPSTFKPFRGTHVDSNRGGVNSYPKPPKPKGGFSTY